MPRQPSNATPPKAAAKTLPFPTSESVKAAKTSPTKAAAAKKPAATAKAPAKKAPAKKAPAKKK